MTKKECAEVIRNKSFNQIFELPLKHFYNKCRDMASILPFALISKTFML